MTTDPSQQPVDAQQVDPQHARSENAGETPPHADAEEMEAALRDRGEALVTDADDELAQARRRQPTEDGPGTSLN